MRRLPAVRLLAIIVCAAAFLDPAAALDRRVRIVNESSQPIVAFHGAYVGTDDWGDNMLGEDVLAPKANVVLNFEDGSGYCRFGFRATFADGVELQKGSVNICEIGTYRYTD